mmetsp:Transcript_10458/g.15977  ORF Transcript_10458/g.15977 Transcript_10458/m.15977 type:complete len:82 (+) Transcript_10458:978-1223(+)
MGPKIQAAIDFVQKSSAKGNKSAWAAIADLKDASKIMSNEEGTIVKEDHDGEGVVWREPKAIDNPDVISPKRESQAPHRSG